MDGRKRRFSNTMRSCLGSRLALRHNYDSKVADLFKYGGKSLRFRKYPATCGRGLSNSSKSYLLWTSSRSYTNNFTYFYKCHNDPLLIIILLSPKPKIRSTRNSCLFHFAVPNYFRTFTLIVYLGCGPIGRLEGPWSNFEIGGHR